MVKVRRTAEGEGVGNWEMIAADTATVLVQLIFGFIFVCVAIVFVTWLVWTTVGALNEREEARAGRERRGEGKGPP
jgi:hypothetical protein